MSLKAVTAYERYVERAMAVVAGAPYWGSIANEDFAKISVDGDEVTLWWLDISSGYYGSWETDSLSVSFPARLLALSDADFIAWKEAEHAKYVAERKERARLEAAARRERVLALHKSQTEAALTHGVMIGGKLYRVVPEEKP